MRRRAWVAEAVFLLGVVSPAFGGDFVINSELTNAMQQVLQSSAAQCLEESSIPAPPPATGLQGRSNYLLYSNCQPLINLSVTIDVSSTMVSGPNGLDFQLNAYSLADAQFPNGATPGPNPGPSLVGWQQIILNVRPSKTQTGATDITAFYEPWPSSDPGVSNGSDLVKQTFDLITLKQAAPPSLPAGTVVNITLSNDPSTASVNGFTFTVTPPPGVTVSPTKGTTYFNGQLIQFLHPALPLDPTLCTNKGRPDPRFCPDPADGPSAMGPQDTAPLMGFQLDLAGSGPAGVHIPGGAGIFQSGAGTITYAAGTAAASQQLTPIPNSLMTVSNGDINLPVCMTGKSTAEGSTAVFSTMPTCTLPGTPVTQTFNAFLACQPGADPYYFRCDGSQICSTPANAAECLNVGMCSPFTGTVSYSSPYANQVVTCSNNTAPGERDPMGNWLSNVKFDVQRPTCASLGGTGIYPNCTPTVCADGTPVPTSGKCPAPK